MSPGTTGDQVDSVDTVVWFGTVEYLCISLLVKVAINGRMVPNMRLFLEGDVKALIVTRWLYTRVISINEQKANYNVNCSKMVVHLVPTLRNSR